MCAARVLLWAVHSVSEGESLTWKQFKTAKHIIIIVETGECGVSEQRHYKHR